jgi:hypothetical protein
MSTETKRNQYYLELSRSEGLVDMDREENPKRGPLRDSVRSASNTIFHEYANDWRALSLAMSSVSGGAPDLCRNDDAQAYARRACRALAAMHRR